MTLRLPTEHDRAHLISVALAKRPADLVVKDAMLLNGPTGELIRADIAVSKKWIAAVGELPLLMGPETVVIDAGGLIVTAGLIDSHFHLEGSMVTVGEIARALLPRGVTTLMCDPHEIGNVLGGPGISALIDEASGLPLKVHLRVPPHIPGTPGFETTRGSLDDETFSDLLAHPGVIALAGDCAPNWLLEADLGHLRRVGAAIAARLTVNGQDPGLEGPALAAFVASGVQDTHIATSCEMLLRELRLGLRVIVNDMPEQFPDEELRRLSELIASGTIDTRNLLFCADDVHPNRLLANGGVDAAVRRAIRCGIPWRIAFRMATVNAATHYRIDHLYGSVLPGRVADLVILADPQTFKPHLVIADGQMVDPAATYITPKYPNWTYGTVRFARELRAEDFALPIPAGAVDGDEVVVTTIYPGVPENERLLPGTVKRSTLTRGQVEGGRVILPADDEVCLAAVVERHVASGRIGRAALKGLGLRAGAVASTVNHDNHHVVVVGASEGDMAVAANAVASLTGGVVVVREGRVVAELPLPIAGLLSDQPIETVAETLSRVERALVEELGVSAHIVEPLMLVQMFALANIPTVGLTDVGIVDVIGKHLVDAVASRKI